MCKRNPLCVHSQKTGKDGPSGVVFTARELEKMAPWEVPGWGITDPSLFCIWGFVFPLFMEPWGTLIFSLFFCNDGPSGNTRIKNSEIYNSLADKGD